jgi:hypothetical protein
MYPTPTPYPVSNATPVFDMSGIDIGFHDYIVNGYVYLNDAGNGLIDYFWIAVILGLILFGLLSIVRHLNRSETL